MRGRLAIQSVPGGVDPSRAGPGSPTFAHVASISAQLARGQTQKGLANATYSVLPR
jgi:hypothetical protein